MVEMIALARRFEQAVGVDISAGMLAEAERNARVLRVSNTTFHRSVTEIADRNGSFSFINSYIVLQHVSPARGLHYVSAMLQLLSSDGFGAIHVTYGRTKDRRTNGVRSLHSRAIRLTATALQDSIRRLRGRPLKMQMNPYPLNQLMFMLQDAGARELHAQFTNHGGHLGVVLLFRKGDGLHLTPRTESKGGTLGVDEVATQARLPRAFSAGSCVAERLTDARAPSSSALERPHPRSRCHA